MISHFRAERTLPLWILLVATVAESAFAPAVAPRRQLPTAAAPALSVVAEPPGTERPAQSIEELEKNYHKSRAKQALKKAPGGSSQMASGGMSAKPKAPVHPLYNDAEKTPAKVTIPAAGGQIELNLSNNPG